MLAIAIIVWLPGCVSNIDRPDAIAVNNGLLISTIEIDGYSLRAYRNRGDSRRHNLHIYLDGDGRPWRTRTRISADPTPRYPLALELMALDPAPSLYLGRPCYFGQSKAPGCHPDMWTFGRYSPKVIGLMGRAVREILRQEHIDDLTLIGYSGGGVIAWLLAERIPETTRLVTIAANLDLDAWTRLRGFTPLLGSLDPAKRPPLPDTVQHWHLMASQDRVVPPHSIPAQSRSVLRHARIQNIQGDHRCCWTQHWSRFLVSID